MTDAKQEVGTTDGTVLDHYRGVICDLDGVVYRGSEPVPRAVTTLNAVDQAGLPVVFATNNASRSPRAVAEHLRDLGLTGVTWSVVTSAQAAAAYIGSQVARRSRVLAVGGPGVPLALEEVGLVPVRAEELAHSSAPVAIVQGAGQDVTWRELTEVGYLAQRGAIWVATNLDSTVPTSRGPAPGNGAFVGAVRAATTAVPHVTGKPSAALFDLGRARLGAERCETIVVGDRLDTDIAGANAAGLDSMLVLSGACTLRDLAFSDHEMRPTYVALDLSGLLCPRSVSLVHPTDEAAGAGISTDGTPFVRRPSHSQRLLRDVTVAAWRARDEGLRLSDDADLWARFGRQLGTPPG